MCCQILSCTGQNCRPIYFPLRPDSSDRHGGNLVSILSQGPPLISKENRSGKAGRRQGLFRVFVIPLVSKKRPFELDFLGGEQEQRNNSSLSSTPAQKERTRQRDTSWK